MPTAPWIALPGTLVKATAALPFMIQEAKKYPTTIRTAEGTVAMPAYKKRFLFPFLKK